MNLIAKRFEPDIGGLKIQLRHWFRFDHLRPEQGIALLIGIKPSVLFQECVDVWPDGDAIKGNLLFGIDLINGDEITAFPKSEDEEVPDSEYWTEEEQEHFLEKSKKRLRFFVRSYQILLEYWNSGNPPECTPLSYFVQWGKSKGINPDWEPVAVESGFLTGQDSVNDIATPTSADEPGLSIGMHA
ncbi:MAG: hypothetical protein Q8O38_00095 [Sulfurimicrobium sp.]|nr:hypothetical protein [Sulfurimicrobium sp.]